MKFLKSILLAATFILGSVAGNAQITAATCSTADVQTAINAATTGQTITIPACPSGVSWTSGVTINKLVSVQGSGSGRIIAVSSTTQAIGTGTKTWTVQGADPGNALVITAGMTLNVTETNNRSNKFSGTVANYNSGTGALVMNITSSSGNCTLITYPSTPITNCGRWMISTAPTTVLIHNSSTPLFSVTEQVTGSVRLGGFKIAQGTGTGRSVQFNAASSGQAIVLQNCWIEQGSNSDTAVHTGSNRGVISKCSFDSAPFSMAPLAIQMQPFDETAWNTTSFFGTNDTTGQNNLYIEDNDFHAYLNATDNDEGARSVFRYNMLDNSGFGTHGVDSGPLGSRYFEFYNNVGVFEGYTNSTTFNMNWWMFVRGGTYVITNNTLPPITSQDFNTKLDVNMTVMNLQRTLGPNPCWGAGHSGGTFYYTPRQVGMGRVTGTGVAGNGSSTYNASALGFSATEYVGDPEPGYIWNNSRQPLTNVGDSDYGSGSPDSCPPSPTPASSVNYIVANRDYFNGSTAKPGYTPYQFPHPLALSAPHTYYVSTAGSDSNIGTLASPWLTPSHASSVAVAGDTVLFLDGTYTLPAGGSGNGDWFITSSGTSGNPITFRSATKWGAKLVGTDSSGSTSVIGLSGSYLTIQDFDITGVDSNGINMTTNVTSATGNVAQGNYIHDMTTPCTSNSGAGITSGGGASYTSVDHMSMIGNFVVNILDTGGSCHASAGLAMMIPFGTVANNIVINSGTDIETWHAASNEVIFGNTTIGGLIGITLGAGDSPGGITNSNSVVQSNIMIGASAVGMQEHGTTAVSNVFTNNLTFGNATNVQLLNGHTDPHLITANPLFVNNTGTVAGNYSLQTASPARGTGLALAGISADYLGNPRPSSGATDIGAILYTTVPKVLTKITILPPSTGFFIVSPTNTGSAQLSVLCIYSDASTDNCSSVGGVTWFSDNSSMMTINSAGLATGTGSPVPSPFGPIYVNIIAYNGTVFGRTQLQVNSYTVNCLITRPETPDTNVVIGSTILVSAVDCSPDSGASSPPINGPGVGDFVAYTTSDPTKAIVNPQGEVTAVGAGSATITLHLPGITATRNITITNPTITNTTYYVREDGGTIRDANVPGGQCDGTLNVALAGSSGGHCAVNNPMYCFTDETSSTVYTGIVKGGDTCMVTPRAGGAQYSIVLKSPGVGWIGVNSITMAIPSGTPANPTKLLGSNYASCSTDAHALGNRVAMNSLGQSFVQGYNYSTQNIDIECVDFDSGVDCNSGLHTNSLTFACPSGAQQEPAITVDQFTSNFQMKNVRIHGYYTSMDGTPGPGTRWINVTAEFNTLDGTNFDNPYGYTGNRGDGFYADGAQFNFNGFSEDRAKPLSGGSVSRDGSGNLNVTFPSGSIVNYVVGTNLVLAGMTPSDLNGTFPVSAITFNQRTVNITGGNIVSYNDGYVSVWGAEFTTSAAPTFPLGSFVNITGASPSFLNGTYEVFSVSGTGFVVAASQYVHPGWTGGTISNGGTASVAVSLVASAIGSSETASVLGTASHVTPAHRGMDQQDTGFANGDGWGSGNAAMNDYLFTNCQFHRNTQDGLDGLHSNIHTSTFTFCVSEGNEGAPVKAGNADFVFHTNSLMDSNAGANMAFDPNLPPEYNQYLSTFFRANDGYGINNGAWSTFIASNNTFEVGQNVFIDDRCNSPSGCRVLPFAHFYFQNNNVLGYNDLNNPIYDGSPPALYFAEDGGVPDWQWFNNISFNTRNPPSGGSGNFWNTDPLVVRLIPDIANLAQEVNALFGNYNINLTTGSSAIQGGVANLYVPTTDFNHTATTFPNPVVGALNLAGSTPTLVSVAVTPNPGSVNVASTLAMTCIAAFSDGSHSVCSSPAWTDTSGHSSVNMTTGVVTGISSGADTIRATVGTIFGTATVNVIAPSTYRTHSLGRTKSLGTTKSN